LSVLGLVGEFNRSLLTATVQQRRECV